ncbi:MAG: NAD(+) synthase [Planctomycetia bacterium]|nr:NAD(+) synthase [Planctomycetia bacterium]
MLRDWEKELRNRVSWIREYVGESGIIFGNSGGKDSALVGILCRRATEKVYGVIMPCQSAQNFGKDREHALLLAKKYNILTLEIDLSEVKAAFLGAISPELGTKVKNESSLEKAQLNVNPRLRMMTLYTLGQAYGCLVVGTGNRSEKTMGYFTKWGDGACDFNPIGDLTVTEIYEFLEFLGAPREIIEKAPSAGLFDGQTDESEMGITYAEIDEYLLWNKGTPENKEKIEKAKNMAAHKTQVFYFHENDRK